MCTLTQLWQAEGKENTHPAGSLEAGRGGEAQQELQRRQKGGKSVTVGALHVQVVRTESRERIRHWPPSPSVSRPTGRYDQATKLQAAEPGTP